MVRHPGMIYLSQSLCFSCLINGHILTSELVISVDDLPASSAGQTESMVWDEKTRSSRESKEPRFEVLELVHIKLVVFFKVESYMTSSQSGQRLSALPVMLPLEPVPQLTNTDWTLEGVHQITVSRRPQKSAFLVSFLVDARGCFVEALRRENLHFFIPPNAIPTPTRIICRLVRPDMSHTRPLLNDGDAFACRLMEMRPSAMKFASPILMEVPHFASLRDREREIIILRSDNGDTWKEHQIEATDQSVDDALAHAFDNIGQTRNSVNMHRILTTDLPQYFALVSRFRQEVALIGPDGGVISSSVVPQVQAVFPAGALQKRIKVALQAQELSRDLIRRLYGEQITVSPIVTIEPRRRKFHKPITLTIPLPAKQGNVRLLCSIAGGADPAKWEDITGSTHMSKQKQCLSFTTAVSARLWLIDCAPNCTVNVVEAANTLYRESITPPFMARLAVYAKQDAKDEKEETSQMRTLCLIDDTPTKTLECQENFKLIGESAPIEVLDTRVHWLQTEGNLFVKEEKQQDLNMRVKAFHENRLSFRVHTHDPQQKRNLKMTFRREKPITTMEIVLPPLGEPITEVSSSLISDIGKSDLNVEEIARSVGADWKPLALRLGMSPADISMIASLPETDEYARGRHMLSLWEERSKPDKPVSLGNTLAQALSNIGRQDVVRASMTNIRPVTNAHELFTADSVLRSEEAPETKALPGESFAQFVATGHD
ncbi:Ankyrin-2 [Cichlidogyrus casuarinus]|uniref:Ankyrin-2 n=1 Tax=Cichlidogyrus casuarinus TaxID=1844966 RepID=A0ABD2Q9E1_9PLAT